ncbi:Metal dependent phosphohydrolase [Pseudodesulfovibrio profundus]|uniref:Metal dependent phosphohydrolase n=1 Tax=Pseudodesulfovibrio profundus TaxID=57320 RepID=A0A2C8FA60_9BACT|nr:HD-GYP domain-containing protein [Pseudodesulfovibrio profundus]SOB59668.1 Metal dependent phosphohydrolase [Pseudodesulfovibrio profundus]
MPEYRISVDLLRPGVFIRLEKTNWFDHPFLFSKFKVKDEEQVALLRNLGITHVVCIPEKSDVLPKRPTAGKKTAPEAKKELSQEVIDRLWEVKKERTRRLREKKLRIAECEEKFNTCIKPFDNILKGVMGGNSQSIEDAIRFVDRLSRYFLDDTESTLHLMNVVDPEEIAYSHPMNVAVLSLMVGREAGLDGKEMLALGLGALFHDIGKYRIPKKLLKKRGPLTKPEQALMDQHAAFGASLLSSIKVFPNAVARIVAHHHERIDGSGGPEQLKGDAIDSLARIVAIADTYDNHTNSKDPDKSLTPYLALSYMFGQQKQLFDVEMLALFIRCLGVYPPGTVVELSNGAIGMVMAVNPKNQLNPSVVLYDDAVPKKEALIVDLAEEPDLRVEKSIRVSHLPQKVRDYLSPRTKITYYVDPS